jgi:hypothetical protein
VAEWTIEDVAARFDEAARTAQRLPPVRVQGYFSVWPAFRHDEWQTYAAGEYDDRPLPPSPKAVERMQETMRWVQWLDVEERHLVWMRAKGIEWKIVCRRFGCDRTTAWRHWRRALQVVAGRLNAVAVKAECMRAY